MTADQPEPADADRLAAERRRLQTDAVGGSVWITGQTILVLPVSILANVVVAHSLGARNYGTLATFTAVYGVVVALLNAGVSDATVQWIATHRARGESELQAEIVSRCAGYHLVVEAPLLAVLTAVLLRDSGPWAMAIGAGSSAVVQVLGTSSVVMSGAALNALAARISLVTTLATQTTLITVAFASPLPASVFVGRLALSVLGPLLALVLIPGPMRAAVLHPRLPRRWPPGFIGYAVRTAAAGVVSSMVFGRSELFVFQTYGLPEQAGLFALGAGVAALITAPIDSLLGPLLPATTGLLATTPERAGPALLRGLRTSSLLAGLVAAVGIPTVAPLLPLIYGRSFSGASGAFVALAVVSCIQSVNHPVVAFQLAARRTDQLLRTSLIGLTLDTAVAVAAVPFWGVGGAVLASAVAQLTVIVVTARQVGRLLGVSLRGQLRSVGYLIDALVIMSVALGVELLLPEGPAVVRAVAGCGAALLAVGMAGRLRRGTGLARDDVAVIDQGLPTLLRGLFRFLVRVFALEQRPATESQPVPSGTP